MPKPCISRAKRSVLSKQANTIPRWIWHSPFPIFSKNPSKKFLCTKGAIFHEKSDWITGVLFLLTGIGLLLAGLFTGSALGNLLFGFAGAGIGPGLFLLGRYVYWSWPSNQARYQDRQEQIRIEFRDERKEMLRDKSGRYAYVMGLLILSVPIVVLSVLGALDILPDTRGLLLFPGAYLLFQFIAGALIFRRLSQKY